MYDNPWHKQKSSHAFQTGLLMAFPLQNINISYFSLAKGEGELL